MGRTYNLDFDLIYMHSYLSPTQFDFRSTLAIN